MLISSMLSPTRTRAKVEGSSKKRVLQSIASLFAEQISDLDADKLFQSFLNRERLGSTGIGEGVAIPHCRFETGGKTYAACLSLCEAVDFDAVDSKPVDLVFAMLVPEDAEQAHLEALAKLAEAMSKESYTKALRRAKTDEQLFEAAIASGEDK